MTNPTMRRRWANVALSTITQLREPSKCICCPNVGSTLIFRPCPIPPCADVGPALPDRPSPDVAHTQNAYVGSTSKFRPRPIRPCTGIGPTLPGRPLPDFAHNQNAYVDPMLARRQYSDHVLQSDHVRTLGQRCPTVHHPMLRTLRMHTLAHACNVGSSSTFRPRPIRPCADVGPTSHCYLGNMTCFSCHLLTKSATTLFASLHD